MKREKDEREKDGTGEGCNGAESEERERMNRGRCAPGYRGRPGPDFSG